MTTVAASVPLVIRNTLPSPHVSPLTSYFSRPYKGKVISPKETGILYR